MMEPTLNKKEMIDFSKIGVKKKKRTICVIVGDYGKCKVCGVLTDMWCGVCWVAPYCSESHHKEDHQNHSKDCSHLRGEGIALLEDDKDSSPYFVFTKDVPGGKALLTEIPILVLPKLPKEYHQLRERNLGGLKLVCFGCHQHYYSRVKPAHCNLCGIPMCSEKCKNCFHEVQECKILRKFSGRNFKPCLSSTRKYVELYLDIAVIRILCYYAPATYNQRYIPMWKSFMRLSKTARYKKFTKTTEDYYDGVRYMDFMKKSVNVLKFSLAYAGYNREIVQQVYKTMIVFWEEFEYTDGIPSRVLFVDRHFMAQSYCVPNVAVSVIYGEGENAPSWLFYAIKDIRKNKGDDDRIRVIFDFSPNRFMPLPLRIMYLNNIGLRCTIDDSPICGCNDPSDGRSNSGSIRCLQCYDGCYMEYRVRGKSCLHDFPKRWSPEYVETMEWICSNSNCEDIQPFSFILKVNKNYYEYWQYCLSNSGNSRITTASNFVDFVENSFLHPYNGTVLQAKFYYLMAVRERHFTQCGLDRYGRPYMVITQTPDKKIIQTPDKSRSLRLFPTQWNMEELCSVYKRLEYAAHCKQGLDLLNPNYRTYENCDYTFLQLEEANASMVAGCHHFLMNLNQTSADGLFAVSYASVEVFDLFVRKKDILLKPVFYDSPLMKWPFQEMNKVVKMHRLEKAPFPICLMVLRMMRTTVGKFMMGDGAYVDQRHDEGIDDWPQSFEKWDVKEKCEYSSAGVTA